MFDEIKRNTVVNLQGSIVKSFCRQAAVYISFLIFVLSSFVCVWFLIIDTTPLASIGIFDNVLPHIAVCAFAVVENLILFCIYLYSKLKTDAYFYNIVLPSDFTLNIKTVVKYFSVYIFEKICKAVSFFMFFLPSAIVLFLTVKMLDNGISRAIFAILASCLFILISFSIYSYSVFICKYSMLTFAVLSFGELSVTEIFHISQKLTNGKCRSLYRLKIYNIPKYVLSLLILPAVYYLPYCKLSTSELLMEDKKPYAPKKAHTEKSIVFYFNPVKET